MGVFIGIVAGAAITVAVTRYYFLRSLRKRLGAYIILRSAIFAGMDPEVRKGLRFTFKDKEVSNLQLLQIVLVNEGEHAIRNFLDPPKLTLPEGIEVVDASVIHREPSSLNADIRTTKTTNGLEQINLDFALLNKGEYFIAKLLLNGNAPMSNDSLSLQMQGDELPRSIPLKYLSPFDVTEGRGSRVGALVGVAGALVFSTFVAAQCYLAYFFHSIRPDVFPYPWHSFKRSWEALAFVIDVPLDLLFAITAVTVVIMACVNLCSRDPGFRIPKGLAGRRFSSYALGSGVILSQEFLDEQIRKEVTQLNAEIAREDSNL